MAQATELIPRIYDAGCGQSDWDGVMKDLADLLGAAGHLTYQLAKDPQAGRSAVLSNHGFGPDVLGRYFDHYVGCNVWAASDAMVPGAVFTSSMLYPDERLKYTEYWNGWLRHVDVFYVVGGIIHDDADSRTKVSFVRPENGLRFEAAQKGLLEGLAPHFQAALGTRRRLEKARSLLDTLDEVDQGVLLLRADGRILHMNACAQVLLRLQNTIRVQGDRLEFTSPDHSEQFRALGRTDVQLARSSTMYLRLQGPGGLPLQAALMRLPDDIAGSRRFALFIKQQRDGGAPTAALRQLYGLTRAEAELAAALATGQSLAEVARARGATIHTVRTQLKAVMQKLGTNRQAEIVQIVGNLVHRHDKAL